MHRARGHLTPSVARYRFGMSRATQLGGPDIVSLIPLIWVLAAVVVPLLLGRRRPPPGQADDDSGGGGGPGPPPPAGPESPRGGLPMPSATQSRVRLRGHERLAEFVQRRDRRPAREPDRVPAAPPLPRASARRPGAATTAGAPTHGPAGRRHAAAQISKRRCAGRASAPAVPPPRT